MNPYRTRKDEKKLEQDKQRFWARYRQASIRYALLVTGAVIGAGVSYVVYRAVNRPHVCKDTVEVISEQNSSRTCDPDQTLDTTRMRQGNGTNVLMRCWCNGHTPKGDEAAP